MNEGLGTIVMTMPLMWAVNLLVGLLLTLTMGMFARTKWLSAVLSLAFSYVLMVLLGARLYDATIGIPALRAVHYFAGTVVMLSHPLFFAGMILIPQVIAFLFAMRTGSWKAALVQVLGSVVLSTVITLGVILCIQPSILRLVFGPDEMSRGL